MHDLTILNVISECCHGIIVVIQDLKIYTFQLTQNNQVFKSIRDTT